MLSVFKNRWRKQETSDDARPPLSYLPGEPNEYYRDFVSSGTFRHAKKPLIRLGDPIFTIGSCFANQIRSYFDTNRLADTRPRVPAHILPLFHNRSKEVSGWGEWDGISNLQYYNTFSIRQEFEKASGEWIQPPDDYWAVTIGDTQLYQCPYRRRIFAESPEQLREITVAIDDEIKQGLNAAKLVILTLGLTEVWQKKDNGLFSCCEPGYCEGGGHEETEFVASTFEQNLENIRKSVEILNANFKPEQIVISVSPIPLGRTFRPTEVSVANTESKSILRLVAGCVESEQENVTYFPSYEMCLTDPNTFKKDGRHVKVEKADQIMELFKTCHVDAA